MSRNRRAGIHSAMPGPVIVPHADAAVAGFEAGYRMGWRDGACEAVLRHTAMPVARRRNVRAIYVPQGFQAIDEGVTHALRETVKELHVVPAERMAEQAMLIRPDLVFVLNGLHVFPDNHFEQIDTIRAAGIRTVIWFADDPYVTEDTVKVAPHYNTVLTHELSTIPLYQSLGCSDVHYMPLAVHPALFKPFSVAHAYRSDVCFIGQAFWNRVELFDALAEQLVGLKVFIAGGLWERLASYDRLKRFIRQGWLPVEESIQYYNGARIVINMHRTTEAGLDNKNTYQYPGRSINPRTYEIAACGTLQLTDIRDDLIQHYQPGIELDTFQSAQELGEKIRFYLANEELRSAIAVKGLARTLREHTYMSRMEQVMQALGYFN
ncbi:CgeB family protein [Paenibacillus sp. MMS18-CY102]|uniref:CgeB family protein n=1 Tax=Paenibacillus sp. MMS18-CY102 TaxID=2682849 RepID=UPI0013651F8B|nr:glycosyltransferase [Paenibacillus sp. MMS18-CY102]MWC28650.1 glycosyltransferase [Paenibacillus sp. MMS18-CY102]